MSKISFSLTEILLLGTKFNAPVIINCQVGLARSTTGCVIACLFREYQVMLMYRDENEILMISVLLIGPINRKQHWDANQYQL